MFKTLSPEEEIEFRQWAKDNATQEHWDRKATYHPVVRNEWERVGYRGDHTS